MPTTAKAWLLYPAREGVREPLAELVLEDITLPDIEPDQVLAEPLYGSWEGNMHHALARSPVDICALRDEPSVVVGNAGVVRVLEVGDAVTTLKPGQAAMMFSAGEVDRYGYMTKAAGYDAVGTMGCLATRMVCKARCLIPLPDDTKYSMAQWAAFSIRYVTAWSNWELAHGTFRLQLTEEECPSPHVWGWGGGTTLAELELAKRHGARCVMLSSRDDRLQTIAKSGIEPLDRRSFRGLSSTDPEIDAQTRRAAEKAFLAEVRQRTDGEGVHIFLDYIGTPTLHPTLRALSREGVLATAGWRAGMETSHYRAVACIKRHQHIHTHYARYPQGVAAIEYGERTGWMPELDEPITPFDEVNDLARRFARGDVGYFPLFAVNPE